MTGAPGDVAVSLLLEEPSHTILLQYCMLVPYNWENVFNLRVVVDSGHTVGT